MRSKVEALSTHSRAMREYLVLKEEYNFLVQPSLSPSLNAGFSRQQRSARSLWYLCQPGQLQTSTYSLRNRISFRENTLDKNTFKSLTATDTTTHAVAIVSYLPCVVLLRTQCQKASYKISLVFQCWTNSNVKIIIISKWFLKLLVGVNAKVKEWPRAVPMATSNFARQSYCLNTVRILRQLAGIALKVHGHWSPSAKWVIVKVQIFYHVYWC